MVMEGYAFSGAGSLYRWDPRAAARGMQELFEAYGVPRFYTAVKLAELGFTVHTLLNMKDQELDEMMDCLSRVFRSDSLVGERHSIKAAVGAERRRLFSADAARALGPQRDEGGPMHKQREAAGSSGGGLREAVAAADWRRLRISNNNKRGFGPRSMGFVADDENKGGGGGRERRREHPFVVTVPGEVARGKKNGLDYLFNLYEQCRQFLIHFQNSAKETGQKYPTKVTNQVFRFAQLAGASYINKPKMRHYVHCYALHCLDEATSDALRTTFKMHNEGVGAWRQACYGPLVAIAAGHDWDMDAIFSLNPRLSIWYVPAKLRQLCHSQRLNTTPPDPAKGGYEL